MADGLARMFVSRNNDVDGYWAVGQLRSLLGQRPVLEIDLLVEDSVGESPVISRVRTRFLQALQRQCRAAHLAPELITVGRLELRCDGRAAVLDRIPYWGRGDAAEVRVRLELSSGHSTQASAYCRVEPHDPVRETRRLQPAGDAVLASMPERVRRKLVRIFPAEEAAKACRQLQGYGAGRGEPERERVWLAILKLSQEAGHADVEAYVRAAIGDYRDVLAWAEAPAQMALPPQASARARAMAARRDRLQYQQWLDADGTKL